MFVFPWTAVKNLAYELIFRPTLTRAVRYKMLCRGESITLQQHYCWRMHDGTLRQTRDRRTSVEFHAVLFDQLHSSVSKSYECAVYRYQKTAVFKVTSSSSLSLYYSPISRPRQKCNERRFIKCSSKTNGIAEWAGISGRLIYIHKYIFILLEKWHQR